MADSRHDDEEKTPRREKKAKINNPPPIRVNILKRKREWTPEDEDRAKEHDAEMEKRRKFFKDLEKQIAPSRGGADSKDQ